MAKKREQGPVSLRGGGEVDTQGQLIKNPAPRPESYGPGSSSDPSGDSGSSNDPNAVRKFLDAFSKLDPEHQAGVLVKGLTYGQEQDPNADLLNALMSRMGGLPAGQATTLLSQIPQGSVLAGDLSKAFKGEGVADILKANQQDVNPSQGGFDPLSIANYAQNVITPFLTQEQQQSAGVLNNLASVMSNALKGAPANIKNIYGPGISGLSTALQGENAATANAAVTNPELDNLTNQLAQAVQQYKLAQGVYSAAPYYQALQSGQMPNINLTPGMTGSQLPTSGLIPPPTIP